MAKVKNLNSVKFFFKKALAKDYMYTVTSAHV